MALLEHAGPEGVSVPYYEWDRIPHWSSMERERYLQRKLGITTRLVYDGVREVRRAVLGADRQPDRRGHRPERAPVDALRLELLGDREAHLLICRRGPRPRLCW